jgi:hypothetical protein
MHSALRWRAVGTCSRQHRSEQKRSFMRPELHDETEQRKCVPPVSIATRHVEHIQLDLATFQPSFVKKSYTEHIGVANFERTKT